METDPQILEAQARLADATVARTRTLFGIFLLLVAAGLAFWVYALPGVLRALIFEQNLPLGIALLGRMGFVLLVPLVVPIQRGLRLRYFAYVLALTVAAAALLLLGLVMFR